MVRIPLGNTVFEGGNTVYLLGHETGGPTTLVDTGVAFPEVAESLREGLADHGVTLADVDQVLLTHFHEDHAGLAGRIQAAGGATVRIHEGDAPLVDRGDDTQEAYFDHLREHWEVWGMPPAAREELAAFLDGHDMWADEAATVEPFSAGERIPVGERHLEALHLPGHTAGQTGFYDPAADVLYPGDALLPVYTPNVGGADVRVEEPLAEYVDSLRRIVDLAPARAMPGHRDPIEDPVDRAREILEHHRERAGRVVDVLRDGPADPWTVSATLFGDLQDIHILHGPGEAYAHLQHLTDAGVLEREGREYALVESDPSLSTLEPSGG